MHAPPPGEGADPSVGERRGVPPTQDPGGAPHVLHRPTACLSFLWRQEVAIKKISLDADDGVPCTAMREISLLKETRCEYVVRCAASRSARAPKHHAHACARRVPTPPRDSFPARRCRLLDVLVENGSLWLIFEHLDCDLHGYLSNARNGTRCPVAPGEGCAGAVAPHRRFPRHGSTRAGLDLSVVKPLLYQLLLAVHHCHANRVFHRDIKPHNILMRRPQSPQHGWTLKLADFGLARVFNLPLRPYTHEVVTLWYRAPEILLGIKTYSWAVDIWSVACMFAEMLTGRALFPGDSEIDELMRIFRILGTPDDSTWDGVTKLPDWKPCFPKWRRSSLAQVVPQLANNPAGLDLLSAMLRYHPDSRITARDALAHRFFDDLDKSAFHGGVPGGTPMSP